MTPKHLDRYLDEWLQHGLMTPEVARAIREFEGARAKGSRIQLMLSLLAVLSIGLGIISLIAANWAFLPASLKLGVYFALMLLQVYGLHRWTQGPAWRLEALRFFYMLSILAGIGLIAQVFHVPSSGWRGFALWSALSLGIMLQARVWYTVLLWYSGFGVAWAAFIWQHSASYFARLELFTLTLALLAIAATWKGRSSLPEPQRSITLQLSAGFTLLMAPWLLAEQHGRDSLALDGVVALLLAGLWIMLLSRQMRRGQLLLCWVLALAFFARCGIIALADAHFFKGTLNFLEAAAFIVELTALGILALQHDAKRIFDALTLLMAGRIFMLFYTHFASLLGSGSGLIILGILVLLVLRIWYRYHQRWQVWLKGLL